MGRGPVGVILTTMTDGFEVGKLVLKDIESSTLEIKDGREQAFKILKDKSMYKNKSVLFCSLMHSMLGKIFPR